MPKAPEFQIIGSKGWAVMHTGEDHIYLAHPESKPILLKREGDFWSIDFVEVLTMAPHSEDYVGRETPLGWNETPDSRLPDLTSSRISDHGKEFRREMLGLGEPS